MVAGRGITHSERFERARREGGPMHGIQAWVALPREHEETEPGFEHYAMDDLPTEAENGAWLRLIAGECFGLRSRVSTHSPMFYAHVVLDVGALQALPANYPERAAYVVQGAVEVDQRRVEAGQLLVFTPGIDATIKALTPAVLMLLGGEPVGERFIEWNFVSSSKDRIEQAKADWRAQRMKLPDLDDREFIPLPEPSSAPPNPMS
jgi:redox-sensitive bicupin YhaK (pirin superfamily)